MELNMMIIGGMLVATLVVGCFVGLMEHAEERRRRRTTSDIWYRV